MPIPNAHKSRRRWVVLRECDGGDGRCLPASAQEGEEFFPREGLW